MASETRYRMPDGSLVGGRAWARHLRECARRWRGQFANTATARAANEAQAERVDAMAEQVEAQETAHED